MHVMELKPNKPFESPIEFEETMHSAVTFLTEFLNRKHNAHLLGTGMHPLLRLGETDIWPHRHRQIYHFYGRIFNMRQHGWLNIQSYQLNIPYLDEKAAISLHNALAELCAYLPAISASSPIYEGKIGPYVDNRLYFYMLNQKEVPSITGNVIPEYVSSFKQYKREIIEKYSRDLIKAGISKCLPYKDWVNSRGAIFRFDRKAIEIRVIDEQECVKADVALSCFIRAALKGLIKSERALPPNETLVKDFNSVIAAGLKAKVVHSEGPTARHVCKNFFKIAWDNASETEREYLRIIEKRIEYGNLSEIIKDHVSRRSNRSNLKEAIIDVYSRLVQSLIKNEPYF